MTRRLAALLLVAGVRGVLADSILQTGGFSNCGPNASIKVQRVNIEYNNDNKTVIFDVAGSSTKQQNVTAVLNVTAYGNQVYSNTFDPCGAATFVQQLCPGEYNSATLQFGRGLTTRSISSSCREFFGAWVAGHPGPVRQHGAGDRLPDPRHRGPGDAGTQGQG